MDKFDCRLHTHKACRYVHKNIPFNTLLPGENALESYFYENLLEVNGLMVMGINEGITVFDPTELNDNAFPPLFILNKLAIIILLQYRIV